MQTHTHPESGKITFWNMFSTCNYFTTSPETLIVCICNCFIIWWWNMCRHHNHVRIHNVYMPNLLWVNNPPHTVWNYLLDITWTKTKQGLNCSIGINCTAQYRIRHLWRICCHIWIELLPLPIFSGSKNYPIIVNSKDFDYAIDESWKEGEISMK